MSNDSTPPHDARADRLGSWKDVAAYLDRDVTTVQRWEKREGMPVHRHVHEKLGSIYAFRSELDAWAQSRGLKGQSVAEASTDGLPRPSAWRRPWSLTAAAVAAVVGVLAMLVVWTRPTSSAEDRSRIPSPPSIQPAAYDAFLRARYLSVRTTDADSRAAIALLEQAIQLDSGFAAAYGELAAALVTRLAYVTPDETRDLEERAFAAAEKALALDPNVPEAYLARGDLLWSHSHRFAHERAVKEFRRALALDPKSDQAHRRLARVFVHLGFFDEAIHHAEVALSVNPSDAQALNSYAQATLWQGKDQEALAMLLDIPGPVLPELVDANVAFAMFRLGRHGNATSRLAASIREHPEDASGNLVAMQPLLLAESESRTSADLIRAIANRKRINPSHHAAYFAACALARTRRSEEAVQWLREAAETGFPCYELFARDPNLDPIRNDRRFVAFMKDLQNRTASLRASLFPPAPPPAR